MRYFVISLLLLTCASANAQPWQWERMPGDCYNPTGFFQPLTGWGGAEAVGDLDGNGQDEVIQIAGGLARIAERDSAFHWSITEVQFPYPGGISGLWCGGLDTTLPDELAVFGDAGTRLYHAHANPWSWQELPLDSAVFQACSLAAMVVFGDYDSDGLLNIIVLQRNYLGAPCSLLLYERNTAGTCVFDSALGTNNGLCLNLFDGDFDHDGDVDFAVSPLVSDVPSYAVLGENTPQGLVLHVSEPWDIFPLTGPTGGDLDGDGLWEGLFVESSGCFGYRLVETVADSMGSIRTTDSRFLSRVGGPVLGGFHSLLGMAISVACNWRYGDPFFVMDAFELMRWTPWGWRDFSNGFHDDMGAQCARISMADLDGDGLRDILAVHIDHDIWFDRWSWRLWKNVGSGFGDLFSRAAWVDTLIPGANPHTAPVQIGDVTGDGLAELAVVMADSQGVRRVYFFEMSGTLDTPQFTERPELGEGLPVGFTTICLADIDNDELAELIGRTGSSWESYFFRNGHWDLYTGILPPVTANDISFADADNDGDLDLFTPDEVWLNLSPDAVDRNFLLRPSSFSLSAFPNPFNARTEIRFTLPEATRVELALFDILGRRVTTLADGVFPAGEHFVPFDGSNLGSGIYFARLSASHRQTALKLMLIR